MASSTTDADKLRIAIALCALKFRPPDQSWSSYVLDLRAKFPKAKKDDGQWRERVLQLEKEVSDLQAKYDSDHIKLLDLSNQSAAVAASQSTPAPASSHVPANNSKKKKKKPSEPTNQCSRSELQNILKGLGSRTDIGSVLEPRSLFMTFESFQDLTQVLKPSDEQANASVVSIPVLLSTATLALESIGGVLKKILPVPTSPRGELLQILTFLTSHVITTILPLFIPNGKIRQTSIRAAMADAYNSIINTLTSVICIPLLKSFIPLSVSHMKILLPQKAQNSSSKLKDPDAPDFRDDIFNFLRFGIIDSCDSLTIHPNITAMKENIALGAVRQLALIYPSKATSSKFTSVKDEYSARIIVLAHKDAFWYLCNFLHVIFPKSQTYSPQPLSQVAYNLKADQHLLREGLLDAISRLLCHRQTPVGYEAADTSSGVASKEEEVAMSLSVERGMLLAVAERVWEYYVR